MEPQKDAIKKINPIIHIVLGLCIVSVIVVIVYLLLSFKTTYDATPVAKQSFTAYEPESIDPYVQPLNIQIETGSNNGLISEITDTKILNSELGDDYIFADSSQRKLEESEVSSLSQEQLRFARNEIYARHGRKFSDETLQNYFNSKSWYNPQYSPEEFDSQGDSIFNEYEIYNKNVIDRIEKESGYK